MIAVVVVVDRYWYHTVVVVVDRYWMYGKVICVVFVVDRASYLSERQPCEVYLPVLSILSILSIRFTAREFGFSVSRISRFVHRGSRW